MVFMDFATIFAAVAFDEDFEAELSENHEARAEVSLLAQSPDREFTEVNQFQHFWGPT